MLRSTLRNIPKLRSSSSTSLNLSSSYSTSPSSSSPLESELRNALKISMKARNSFRTTVIKSVISDIVNLQHTASPPSVEKILRKAITTRKDAAATFLGKREDLHTQYLEEVEILKEFDVVQAEGSGMSEVELNSEIEKVMLELKLESLSLKSMGIVTKTVLKNLNGRADGKTVSEAVKKLIR